MSQLTIYFVRHGKTLLNQYNRMQGWIDSDLTQDGRKDAIAAAQRLADVNFDYAYSSNTGRAIATRDLMVEHLSSQPKTIGAMSEFREVLFGYYEGLPADRIWEDIGGPHGYHSQAEIIQDQGLKHVRYLMNLEDPSHKAETYDQLINRWQSGIELLKQNCCDNANVLMITHGTALRTFADYLGVDTLHNYPANGSISILQVDDTGERFTSYNQTD